MSVSGDKVPVLCPSCSKRLLVPAGTIGKQGRCPVCQTVFTLEQLFEAETVAAAPLSSYQSPAPASSWSNPAPTNAFADDFGGEYNLQAAPPTPVSNYAPPQVSPMAFSGSYQPAKKKGQFWDNSLLGGIALMVIAVVWFVGGLACNIIFFYPPILFIIGIVVAIKGLIKGNLAGE